MAMTGAISGNRCFVSQDEANDAFYSASLPSIQSGATTYLTETVKVSGVWKIQRFSIAPDGVVTSLAESNAPVMTFPACDPTETFFDGMAIGWDIAAAMVVAASLKLMQRAAG